MLPPSPPPSPPSLPPPPAHLPRGVVVPTPPAANIAPTTLPSPPNAAPPPPPPPVHPAPTASTSRNNPRPYPPPSPRPPPPTSSASPPPAELPPSAPHISPSCPSTPDVSQGSLPRLPIMSRTFRSASSSPRRPRRAGTGLPALHHASFFDFEVGESPSDLAARDEFEEDFFARGNSFPTDREGELISRHLERVDFRQLDDHEEVLSDDALHVGETTNGDVPDVSMQNLDLRRVRQSTVHSNWRRIPSEVGCKGCEGCAQLCGENGRLRRQLDELEFELASGMLHNPTDGFAAPMETVPPIPQIPVASKRKKGWTAKLKNPTSASLNGAKETERSRLKSEVEALTVTTEYLWRKLNKAEIELRDYRIKDLRNRMKMNGRRRELQVTKTPQVRPTQNMRSADWDWD